MKYLCFSALTALLFCYSSTSAATLKPEIPKIIFDSDMGPDYDDIGAIATLHALASKGECEILATVASDGHISIAPVIEFFNTYYNKANIPVGIPGTNAPNFPSGNNWNGELLNHFNKQPLLQKRYPKALDIYREILAREKDNSVTIVTVGFLSNISDLLNSGPDKFSKLSGVELVRKKVKQWVAMAGSFPQGREFNILKDPGASYDAINKWPKPILFSGYEIGDRIMTGGRVAKEGSVGNPIAWGYSYNLRTYTGKSEQNRPSWDQTAVLCAIRDPAKYFYVNGPGKFELDKEGNNSWNADINANHYFLSHKYPYKKVEDVLEELMIFQPLN
jgi:inosine-uridine nucleoside N-ribohydrolase